MKKAAFYLIYFFSPVVPIVLFFTSYPPPLDPLVGVSMSCGIIAFTLFSNQFILAARLPAVVDAVGLKRLISFHSVMPVVAAAFALTHHTLKQLLGMSEQTLQARLGSAALILFVIAIVLTLLLMANTFITRLGLIAALKSWAFKTLHLSYQRMRAAHNVTVVATVAILVHVLLASTTENPANAAGLVWMALWAVMNFGFYLAYRLNGRKATVTGRT